MYKLKDFAQDISVAIKDVQSSPFDRFVGLEHYDSGEPVITRYTDKSLLSSSVKEFRKNDILIARRNVYLKRAGIAFFDGLTSGDSIVLRVYDDCESRTGISKQDAIRIIPFILNSNVFWAYANKHADGMNSKRISKEMLYDYEFDLPPLAEQKVLAEKLWAAYRLKESYKKLLAATEEMVKSQFIEMFGDPYTGWKYPTERLGEVYNIGTGGTPDRKVYGYYEGHIPWVKSTEVSYCELYDTEEHISEQAIKDSNCSLYPSGTILLAMYGQGTTRGRVAQLRTDAAVNQAIAAIQVQDETESLFLYSMLKVCYDYVRNLAVGGNQHNLNLKLVSSIPLIVPPKELQLKFVSIAKHADKSGFDELKSQFIEMFGTIDEPKVEVKKLIDVVLSSGQYGSNTSATDYQEGKPRYIRITDINDDGSLNDDIKTAEVIEDKYRLIPGDIVFARTGATIGKTYMHETGNAIYAGYLIKYQMNESKMKPVFMKAFTHSKTYYNWVANSQKVGAQPNISAAQYDNMPVLVPQIEKQEEFLAIYHQADKSGSVLQYRIAC